MNGALAKPMYSPLGATTISTLSGTIFLGIICILTAKPKAKTTPASAAAASSTPAKKVKWWMWIAGGCTSAFFVGMGSALGPKLGYSLFFMSAIAGQLTCSLLVDHFGFLDIAKSSITKSKLASMTVVFIGAVCAVVERLSANSTSAGLLVLFMVITCAAGVTVSLQVPSNSALSKRRVIVPQRVACLGFMVATIISAIVWGIGLAADPEIRQFDAARIEWWMFLGGILGACYVLQSIIMGPILGIAIFTIFVVAGQLSTGAPPSRHLVACTSLSSSPCLHLSLLHTLARAMCVSPLSSAALIVDTFGLLNSTAVAATPLRLVGVGLVFAGAAAYRLSPGPKPAPVHVMPLDETPPLAETDSMKSASELGRAA
jgi:transporter family-2 protein